MVIVDGNILGENNFQVGPCKCFDIWVEGSVVVIIPVGELVMKGSDETEEGYQTNPCQNPRFKLIVISIFLELHGSKILLIHTKLKSGF